jgi:segregation and condensation protein A
LVAALSLDRANLFKSLAIKMDYQVKLDIFEGPLDLLIHLIKKNEMDIYDIPIAVITAQYLEYLDLMKELNINIAGNFLVMAATLIHIKSRMLLPRPPDEEEDEDPRMELTRPLLEYMQLKAAAEKLGQRPLLDRDVFIRDFLSQELSEKEEGLIRVGLFELMDAVRKMLLERRQEDLIQLPSPLIPIEMKMDEIMDRLWQVGQSLLEDLLPPSFPKPEIILIFLALLELARIRKITLYQEGFRGRIWIFGFFPPAVVH